MSLGLLSCQGISFLNAAFASYLISPLLAVISLRTCGMWGRQRWIMAVLGTVLLVGHHQTFYPLLLTIQTQTSLIFAICITVFEIKSVSCQLYSFPSSLSSHSCLSRGDPYRIPHGAIYDSYSLSIRICSPS